MNKVNVKVASDIGHTSQYTRDITLQLTHALIARWMRGRCVTNTWKMWLSRDDLFTASDAANKLLGERT